MSLFDGNLAHLIGNSMIAGAGSAVDTGPQQKVRAKFMRQAEELVNVTLPTADMNTSAGTTKKICGCLRLSNQRMPSLFSIGTRVGLIFFFKAAVPLNFRRVKTLTAAKPSGTPSVVSAKLECMRMPQTVCDRTRPAFSRPLLTLLVIPIAADASR